MSTAHTPDPSPEHNPAAEASRLPRHVECKCGHDWKSHFEDTFAPQCIAPRCTCLRYIPVTASAREPAAPVSALREPHTPQPEISAGGQQGPTVDALLKAGKRSQIARTVRLAEKIAHMVHDLRSRVADERRAAEERRKAEQEKQQARADVERLTRELANAKARLQGKTPATPAAAPPHAVPDRRGRHINRTPASCPDCGKQTTVHGLGAHRAKAHGYRKAS